MGCLTQLFSVIISRFLWYFILNPIITIVFFLKDIGLIWSISFYVATHYLFLDTFIQDYRLLITVLLLIPFILKVIRQVSLMVTRFTMWQEKRRLKKSRKLKEIMNEEDHYEVEEGDNYYGGE